MTTYAEIQSRADAEAFVASMLATPLGAEHPEAMLRSLRQDASAEWERADGSPLPDAGARALGASLVILELNRRDGSQR